MRYLMFIKHTEDYRNRKPPEGLYAAMGEFVGAAIKAGIMLDGAGLKPTSDANKFRLAKGKITVIDGPFTESKEIVGGYALMECKTKDQALEYGRKFMELHQTFWPEFEGECEVRPLEDPEGPPR